MKPNLNPKCIQTFPKIKTSTKSKWEVSISKKECVCFFLFILKSIELIQIKCNEMFSLKIKTYYRVELRSRNCHTQFRFKREAKSNICAREPGSNARNTAL